jgi:hypothetical protein
MTLRGSVPLWTYVLNRLAIARKFAIHELSFLPEYVIQFVKPNDTKVLTEIAGVS